MTKPSITVKRPSWVSRKIWEWRRSRAVCCGCDAPATMSFARTMFIRKWACDDCWQEVFTDMYGPEDEVIYKPVNDVR